MTDYLDFCAAKAAVAPSAGIGTVPLRAIQAGRRGYGAELNPDYWRDAVSYLTAEENKQDTPSLFDVEVSA